MIPAQRGEIWQANLNPVQGSEQAGSRPVLIFQNDDLSSHLLTTVAIPMTSNLQRTGLPTCVLIAKDCTGLKSDSIVLCNQLRVLDKSRLLYKIGIVNEQTLYDVETSVLYTLGIN